MLYTLAASLGSPTITYGHSHGLYSSTLMASTGIFMNSTTLTRPTLILMGPCKHSHSSATVSRPLVALSIYKHSHCLYKHSYNLYMHSHGLYKHSVVRSCQLFFKIYSCAADFSLLNLPKGKSLGRSKPATNS